MTRAEFRAALAALGSSQRGFASVWGADERTVRKWAGGERPVPGRVPVAFELERDIAALEVRVAELEARLAQGRKRASRKAPTAGGGSG